MNELVELENELIDVEQYKKIVVELFENNGIEDVTKQLVNYSASIIHDVSTEKGRDELSKFVKRIKKSSKLLDTLGKEHVGKLKIATKSIDANRKAMRDSIEKLAEDKLAPLVEFEEAEKARKDAILMRISDVDPFKYGTVSIEPGQYSTDDLKDMVFKIEQFVFDDSLEEFEGTARQALPEAVLKLMGLIAIQEGLEQEVEIERLHVIEAEKKAQAERDERIAKEATERAEAAAKAAIDKAKDDAEVAELKAEADVLAANDRAEAAKKQAADDAEAAAKAERDRISNEAAQVAVEDEKRANDKKHRAKINRETLASMVLIGIDAVLAKKIIGAIVKNKIANVSIKY